MLTERRDRLAITDVTGLFDIIIVEPWRCTTIVFSVGQSVSQLTQQLREKR
jgi:hypothetical protein